MLIKTSFALVLVFLCCHGREVEGTTQQNQAIVTMLQNVQTMQTNFMRKLLQVEQKVDKCNRERPRCVQGVPKNCVEVLACGGTTNGVYAVDPDGQGTFQVYCDQTHQGGGWTVFQKRQDGSVKFFRGWADYKNGFGNLAGEFWLGLDKINRLTQQTRNKLRVELEDISGRGAYAEYGYFAVSAEQTKYRLSLGTYSGDAGDSLGTHRGYPFSTKDRDNDILPGNCALTYKGAWWYNSCHHSNLNGRYLHGVHKSHADGINWLAWKGHKYSARRAEMKIRPLAFTAPQ